MEKIIVFLWCCNDRIFIRYKTWLNNENYLCVVNDCRRLGRRKTIMGPTKFSTCISIVT